MDSKNKADTAEASSIAAEQRANTAQKRSSKAFTISIIMTVVAVVALGVNLYRAYNIPNKELPDQPHLSNSNVNNNVIAKKNFLETSI